MSECISREERRFVRALAEAWLDNAFHTSMPTDLADALDNTARAVTASLEAAPPAPVIRCPKCNFYGVADEHDCPAEAPKPGRVEEPRRGNVEELLEAIIGDLANDPDHRLLDKRADPLAFAGQALAAYRAERAEHESLRERVERERPFLAAARNMARTYGRIVKGMPETPEMMKGTGWHELYEAWRILEGGTEGQT
jgi:hypothetical protein